MDDFKLGSHRIFISCRVEDGPARGQPGGREHCQEMSAGLELRNDEGVDQIQLVRDLSYNWLKR